MVVERDGEDWSAFHEIQRTDLFNQVAADYNSLFHDGYFHRPASRCKLLLKRDGEAVGITTLDLFSDRTAATRSVAISKRFQGLGYGRKLGLLVQEFAAAQGADTLCVNAGAHTVDFYRKLGFIPEVWDRREYDGITDPDSMVQMTCRLR